VADLTIDRLAAESMLNAFAIIEAHIEMARVILGTFPEDSQKLGLTEAVVFWKDRMRALQAWYDGLRRTAALTWLDGQPRAVPADAWSSLNTLDDAASSIAFKAGDVLQARGHPRDFWKGIPILPEVMAAKYGSTGASTGQVILATGAAVGVLGVALWAFGAF
jgi:hypothetical protein